MFCRNCAEVMLDTDITCPKCGFAAGTGVKYCASCGSETPAGTVICEICGQPVSSMGAADGGMQFQQQPQPNFNQQFGQAAQTFQQPQQQFGQAAQTFQQPQTFAPNPQQFAQPGAQQFAQPGAQQFRSADPNAAASFGQPQGYAAPNTFQQNANGQLYQGVTYKSKMTAGLLGIFLGCFGVHNFYLGYTAKAVVQLLLSILSCGTLAIISEIWGLVEGIMILTGSINKDGKGLPLKD